MLLTMTRTVRSEKNVSHVQRFEQLEQSLEGVEGVYSSVCRFDVNGYTIRLTWDEEAGAALRIHCETYGMVRYLQDGWNVDEVAAWVEKASRIIEHMEGS